MVKRDVSINPGPTSNLFIDCCLNFRNKYLKISQRMDKSKYVKVFQEYRSIFKIMVIIFYLLLVCCHLFAYHVIRPTLSSEKFIQQMSDIHFVDKMHQ